jgi:hypothetical protein
MAGPAHSASTSASASTTAGSDGIGGHDGAHAAAAFPFLNRALNICARLSDFFSCAQLSFSCLPDFHCFALFICKLCASLVAVDFHSFTVAF